MIVTTVGPRRINTSLLRILKVERTLGGTEKSWAELEQEAGLVSGPQRKDLSSGFPTMQGSNQPTQLYRD